MLGTLGLGGAAAEADPGSPALSSFDFDTGNFIVELIGPFHPARDPIAPMDVTTLHRFVHYSSASWFDAFAPYHSTAVGVHTRIPRRPASEATNRNKTIAALHSNYQVCKGVEPGREPDFRLLLISVGLNPDDDSMDPTTPVGIGNIAGKGVVAAAVHDGFNQLGDLGPKYNSQPYGDYTGYKPVNTAYDLVHPSRWQPATGPHNRRLGGGYGDLSAFTVQRHLTPQMRRTKAHTFRDPDQFRLAPPDHSDHTQPRVYKRSVDEVLEFSATLTDRQKVVAEFFDNKRLGIGQAVGAAALAHPSLDLDGWVHALYTGSVAIFDALVAVWHQKLKYDAVRPFSAVRHVYGDRKITAWGGPGIGTVNDITGNQWASYLGVGDHSEYPSGSTTLCSAEAQATRRFFNDNVLKMNWFVAPGATLVEPHLTPGAGVALHYETWDDFVYECAISRVWGGVHFRNTVERSVEFGKQFGDRAYEFAQRYIHGDVH